MEQGLTDVRVSIRLLNLSRGTNHVAEENAVYRHQCHAAAKFRRTKRSTLTPTAPADDRAVTDASRTSLHDLVLRAAAWGGGTVRPCVPFQVHHFQDQSDKRRRDSPLNQHLCHPNNSIAHIVQMLSHVDVDGAGWERTWIMWVALSCKNNNMTPDRRGEECRESRVIEQQKEVRPAIESVAHTQRRKRGGEEERTKTTNSKAKRKEKTRIRGQN